MRFRSTEPSPTTDDSVATILAEATAWFGRSPDAVVPDGGVRVEIDGLVFLYDDDDDPPFVLVPECGGCGSQDPRKFALEEWVLLGATVRAQAWATCRTCRFASLTEPRQAGPWPPPGWARTAPAPAAGPAEGVERPRQATRSSAPRRARRWPGASWQRRRHNF